MWNDPAGRKELQKMFLEHGSFECMELALKKKQIREDSEQKAGGWYTKNKLEQCEKYTKSMIAKAWAWAKSKNQWRVNPIHGEEEIRIIASETFSMNKSQIEELEQSGNISDPEGSLFNSDLVDFNAAPGTAVVPGMGSAAPITSGQAGEQLGNTASVMSFKFPFNNTLM
ncbi:unnamed protein product [Durusdinium trenchii]|uniref:Uncharacterized protein n=1 Tax=Durusdinium trenchii TaxID=1381693 RepID=A0ABP0SEW9_9DINO